MITIEGVVRPGQERGGETGAHTANLDVQLGSKLPKAGLYAAKTKIGRETYGALLYYGFNVLSKKDCLEVHVLDFSGVLYRKKIIVRVGTWLRPPIKFKTLTALKRQIATDIKQLQKNSALSTGQAG